MGGRPAGKRVLVTSCDRYVGPPIVELFREEGALVVADASALTDPADLVAALVTSTCSWPTSTSWRVGLAVRDIDDEQRVRSSAPTAAGRSCVWGVRYPRPPWT